LANNSTSSASPEALYEEALLAMARADWPRAAAVLEQLRSMQPNYRDAIDLLVQARVNLAKAEAAGVDSASAGRRTYLNAGLAFAGLILLSALGVLGFSPAARARLHLLRGNPAAAAQIYERMLQRHPERVKFYLPLAHIYLALGKRDERAMQAYKTILHLNLATRNREEINSIVAQKYLTEGRTDSDAIAVLEDALKTERRKQDPRLLRPKSPSGRNAAHTG
jgi:tetratricopeptide (TPR) repeat protein